MGEDRSRGKAASRPLIEALRRWAFSLRRDAHAVWLAARDPRTPVAAKLLGLAVAAYALSPIDLIPDFIPVLGYLDDLVLVPLGLWLAIRMIPSQVMDTHRAAAEAAARRPVSMIAAGAVILIWLAVIIAGGMLLARHARLG
ncbi:MAG: DUF1232 domain-containing protein [Phenylobacterium sp.]|nr:DUF1232 domain-containing protein [Phenylobacterium sp.]MBP7817310.1 DUF1232 domain-containing protein [Phenylobacterium sp.]MBP9231604.1 DUF1232 domain-containing protein [Phenylobacterium sp.]MBP9754265.1 DUF1232 domain-containing protein [Phenylobacterium sp.]